MLLQLNSERKGGRGDFARAGAGLFVLAAALASFGWASEQIAVSRFSSNCIHVTENTWAEAPMKDGEPDYSKLVVYKLKVDKHCAMIQVRKAK